MPVAHDAGSYQRLLERLIERGAEQAVGGEGIPLEEAERKRRRKYGFSR